MRVNPGSAKTVKIRAAGEDPCAAYKKEHQLAIRNPDREMSIAKYIQDSSANLSAFLPKKANTGSDIARVINFNEAPNVASMFCPASFTYLKDSGVNTPSPDNKEENGNK